MFEPKIAPFDLPSTKTNPRTKHEVDQMTVAEIWPYEIGGRRHLGFDRTGNSAFHPPSPKTPLWNQT